MTSTAVELSRQEAAWRRFIPAFAVLLAGYILFDRAFAWVHVPGTPLFVGEIVLIMGGYALVTTRIRPGALIRQSLSLSMLVVYVVWGLLVLLVGVGNYSIDALRDATLWAYGGFAILMSVCLLVRPIEWWLDRYERLVPIIILWMPLALVLDALFGSGPPLVPDSVVSIFSHWDPNVAIHSAIALGLIWAVPGDELLRKRRIPLSVIAVLTMLAAGFSSRAGLLAVSLGALVLIVGLSKGRARLIWLGAASLVAALSCAILFDIQIDLYTERGRSISAEQLADNVVSIVAPERSPRELSGTADWRTGLWNRVIADVTNERPVTGFGFGPNIRERYGEQDEDPPARNPHNSHVNIVARMGWVGGAIWGLMWTVWFAEMLRARKRFTRTGRERAAGLCLVLISAEVMFLVNAIFNEVAEGPHSAVVMWAIFGFGAFLALSRPRSPRRLQAIETGY